MIPAIDEHEQRKQLPPIEPAPDPEWWSNPPQERCEECGRRRYDTKNRLNLPSQPALCSDCFTDPEVLAAYALPGR